MTQHPVSRLSVKVIPGSSRSMIAGWLGNTLKVKVAAPPERGKANAAVVALLAKELGASASSVKIVSGTTSPRKVVEIVGPSEMEIRRKLGALL